MNELLKKLTEKEKEFLKSKKWDTIYDTLELEDNLSDYIQLHCLMDNDNITEEGIVCENILNKIGELE